MSEELEELERQRWEINGKIDRIRQSTRIQEAEKLVGKCFKYRNCYSLPKSDADYWWLYIKVIGHDRGTLITEEFENASDGNISINLKSNKYSGVLDGNYTRIKSEEYDEAWRKLRKLINEKD